MSQPGLLQRRSKTPIRYPGSKRDTMTDEENSLPDTDTGGGSRRPSLVSRSLSVMHLFMHATDGEISRQVPPRGLGVCRGSTRVGQKELALPGESKSKRGNGAAPAALPQDRPVVATRSVLSRGGDQGYGVIQLDVQEIPATG